MKKQITIAIDGPAGAGKSTVARRVAAKLGFLYIDTGAMYRAVALWALRTNTLNSDMHRLEQLAEAANIEFVSGEATVRLNGEDVTTDIRTPQITDAASQISRIPAVRRALVAKQRTMAGAESVVIEGRDIGTVVFPEAGVKIFLDAHPEERIGRRAAETELPTEIVTRNMVERDERDRTRSESPLVQAPDAIYVDTTGLSIEDVEAVLLRIIRERTSNGRERTH